MSTTKASEIPTLIEQEKRDVARARHVHMTLQSKGGIGKTFVARILTEYFKDCRAYDLDVHNQSLHSFSGSLPVEFVNLTHYVPEQNLSKGPAGAINPHYVDTLFEEIMQGSEQHIVMDFGSQLYEPMLQYMAESDMVKVVTETCGIVIWFHLLVCGGDLQTQTVQDVVKIISTWHNSGARILVWQNEFRGAVKNEKDPRMLGVQNLEVWPHLKKKRHGLITLRGQSGMFGDDIDRISEQKCSFRDAISMSSLPVMARSRIRKVWAEYSDQLDEIFSDQKIKRHKATLEPSVAQELVRKRKQAYEQQRSEEVITIDTVPGAAASDPPDSEENEYRESTEQTTAPLQEQETTMKKVSKKGHKTIMRERAQEIADLMEAQDEDALIEVDAASEPAEAENYASDEDHR